MQYLLNLLVDFVGLSYLTGGAGFACRHLRWFGAGRVAGVGVCTKAGPALDARRV